MSEIVVSKWSPDDSLTSKKYNPDGTRARCGIVKKNGIPCRGLAMDNGRCKFHGGRDIDDKRLDPENPRRVPGRPPTHGKYSKYLRNEIGDRYLEFVEDKDFLSLRDEIGYMRGVTSKMLEQLEGTVSEDQVDGLVKLADGVRKLSESYMKIEAQKKYSLNPDEVMRVLTTVVQIISRYVEDPDKLSAIKDELLSIKI